jgi:asparaginyl-tRNA synthetase
MKRTKIKDILSKQQTDYDVVVKGWVRSFRNNQFIALNDGSCLNNLQIVVDLKTDSNVIKNITLGAAISVQGTVVPSLGKGQ